MVKRMLLVSLLVLTLCGASTMMSIAGGPPACAPGAAGAPGYVPQPPGPPPMNGPVTTGYSAVREQICPIPAQLRRVRVVAPYLAGLAWPRTPLAFGGNVQSFPDPIAPGRYEWLVPAAEFKHFPQRCVYVKANYVRNGNQCGPRGAWAPPPPMPMPARVAK
jgi:hypothetical protein